MNATALRKVAALLFALFVAGGSLASAGGANYYGDKAPTNTVSGGANYYGD